MRYCSDTWFILHLFEKDPKAMHILEETKQGKTQIVIPIVVLAEATKKLLQKGVPQTVIDLFFSAVEASDKVTLAIADKTIAQEAARVSLTYSVPLIDSFVAATARTYDCHVLLAKDDDYDLLTKKKYLKVQCW